MDLESNPKPMPPNYRSRTTTKYPSMSEAQFLLMSDKDGAYNTGLGDGRGPGDGVCGGAWHGAVDRQMLVPFPLSLHPEKEKQRKRSEFLSARILYLVHTVFLSRHAFSL